MLNDFPTFMKNPADAIASAAQSPGIEGYVYDGRGGGQMAFWSCLREGVSAEHVHEYDEYFVVLQGEYTLILGDEEIPVGPGQEFFISRGTPHAGRFLAGTRTIHAFGGRRAERNTV
jgi:mannose-6-phosphate isomerase-like protein (cupin superfamily)